MINGSMGVTGRMSRGGLYHRPDPPSGPDGLTPKEVMGILRRHILLIIFMTLLGFCLGGGTWFVLRKYMPSYQAEALIQVLPPIETDPTEISSIQPNKDRMYESRVSMANLLKQQNAYEQLLKRDRVRETRWYRQFNGDHTSAIMYLKKHLTAYPHRDADFVSVSMTCAQAEEAADIVNEMAQWFIKSQRTDKQNEISDKLVEYVNREKANQEEVDAINKSLDDVRDKWGITDISTEGAGLIRNPVVDKLNMLQQDESKLIQQISQMQAAVQNYERLAEGEINDQIRQQIESSPTIIRLTDQIAVQKANLQSKLEKFGPSHRVVRQSQELLSGLETELAERKQQLGTQIRQANLDQSRNILVTLQMRLETVQQHLEEAAKKKEDLDRARVEFERLNAKLKDKREILAEVQAQIEKWRIKKEDPETAKVQLKSAALPPLRMTASRHPILWFPAGTMLGLLLGLGLTFLIELTNDLVRNPNEVSRYLHLPLLGVIPDEDEDDDLPRDADLFQVVRQMPYSLLSESYRRFRTNLELSHAKTILIASGEPEDGRTTCAVNLALSFAAKNKKVVLIDGNFRQPALQRVFPRKAGAASDTKFGLSNLLLGQCTIRQGLRSTGVEGVDLVDTGLLPSNPMELLSSPRMEILIKELSKVYDHIILDSAPVLLVSDAKVLAHLADATVVLCHAAGTRRGAAQRAINELLKVNARLLGCVLFGAKSIKGGYFREQFRSYQDYMQPVGA